MSNLRISGLASGMDTDAMIESMMKVERLKVDRYEQNKQVALWRQESYNNINKMFANFILNTKKDIGLNQINMRGAISSTSYNRLDYVKKATSSNELAATVSSTSEAVNGSFSFKVENMAKGASYVCAKIAKDGDKEATFGDTLKVKLNDEEIEVFKSNEAGITMNDVAKAISDAKKGVTAFYDATNGRLFVQTTETGIDKAIKLEAISGDRFSEFNAAIKGTGDNVEKSVAGQDAQIIFNEGMENQVTLNYSSNNIVLNGVNIELKSEGVSTNINVSTNIEGIMEKVEKLVNDYNELIDKASKLISEKRYSSYHPLSQEEKKALHEDDVKLWTEKAKSGLLNSDETIQKTLQSIRVDLYKDLDSKVVINSDGKKVYNGFGNITQIGITTEKYSRGTAGGKLQIDKEKLRDAIMEDPEGVMEILFKEGNVDNDGKEILTDSKNSSKGIFTRVYDNLIDGMKSIIDKSGPGEDADLYRSVKGNILLDFVTKKSSISDIDKDVLNMNNKIDDLNDMLIRKEDAYYAKFANMEKMLQQMNSQSSWLSQQFMR